MPDPAKIIERVRSNGANVMLDGGKLKLVNAKKLSPELIAFVTKHAVDIAASLDKEAEFDERAAIMEHEGGLTRQAAEYMSRMLISSPPAGANAADWTWWCDQASRIVEGHLARAA